MSVEVMIMDSVVMQNKVLILLMTMIAMKKLKWLKMRKNFKINYFTY